MQASRFTQSTFPTFKNLLNSNHWYILAFIVFAYMSGLLSIFESYIYLLHMGRILVFKYDRTIKVKNYIQEHVILRDQKLEKN